MLREGGNVATKTIVECEACPGKQIHTTDDEEKFRVDLVGHGKIRGFDICADCYEQIKTMLHLVD